MDSSDEGFGFFEFRGGLASFEGGGDGEAPLDVCAERGISVSRVWQR